MSQVREVMTSNPITISSQSSIAEAAKLMRKHDIGILPVLEGNAFCGVVTDRDIVVKALAEGRMDERVGSVATMEVVTVSPDDDVKKATEAMSMSDVRRLPVCEGDKLVGIVSVGDLATRQDPSLAGKVMEKTGPEA